MAKRRVDQDYLDWLSFQPSCINGAFSEYDGQGRGRCVACHVRRSANAGTGYKPLFRAVPLTKAQHDYQHQFGEKALLEQQFGNFHTIALGKEWFDNQAAIHLQRWKESL